MLITHLYVFSFLATGAMAAGKWGSLNDCDLPYVTLQSLFEYLRSIKDQVIPSYCIYIYIRSSAYLSFTLN